MPDRSGDVEQQARGLQQPHTSSARRRPARNAYQPPSAAPARLAIEPTVPFISAISSLERPGVAHEGADQRRHQRVAELVEADQRDEAPPCPARAAAAPSRARPGPSSATRPRADRGGSRSDSTGRTVSASSAAMHSEHGRPVGAREHPEQQAAAEDHADAVCADLDAVREAALAAIEHAHGEPVGGDVLAGRDQVEQECGREHDCVAAREIHLREQQRARHRGRLQRQQPLLARAPVIHERRPQELERPRQEQQARRADRLEREPGVAQQHRQRLREEAERQALRHVQAGEQQDLVTAGHAGCENRGLMPEESK